MESSMKLRASITRLSLDTGLVPKVCPICKNSLPGGILEEHHWGTIGGYAGQDLAYALGKTRRICKSCNQVLGKLKGTYTGDYWSRWFRAHERKLYTVGYTWEEQFELLTSYFRSPKKRRRYPDFDGLEGEWSRFLPAEEWIYERLREGLSGSSS